MDNSIIICSFILLIVSCIVTISFFLTIRMAFNKIITFIIVANFAIFGHVQTAARHKFTLGKYLGQWYEIAVFNSHNTTLSCGWFNITRGNHGNGSFIQHYVVDADGHELRLSLHGQIKDSRLHFPHRAQGGLDESFFTVVSENNGKELIFFNENSKEEAELLSRTPTVSADMLDYFKILATSAGYKIAFVNHTGCRYSN